MSAITRFDIPVAGGALALFRLGNGPGTAEPVVAVHGITASSHAWIAVDRALEGRAALLALDLRGRGASSALPPPYGMEAYARDLLAALDACGLERAVLVGHSLGAYAVARFAADHPDRVRAAVLVDGGLTPPEIEGVDPEAVLSAFLGPALARLELTFESREAYHDWWRAHPAFAGADVADSDLVTYANHDLGELLGSCARPSPRRPCAPTPTSCSRSASPPTGWPSRSRCCARRAACRTIPTR